MAIIKCKMCGGDLNITEGSTVAECEYCGSMQTVPAADSEKKLTLFSRANRLRLACEFDKAAGVYESIVAEFPEEAEAYWGLVLCRYGIEYVDDPRTGRKIPTCHRSSFDSIMEDSDFEQTLENADVVARKVYREEAKAIEELRKGIMEVSGKEEPYDIFICYKETDGNGERTIDSVIAQDVYDALTEKGYRVFFSRISLEDKLGTEYEPYIFAALNSARLMLAFGTDYEYYNAVWVKNEWSRFLALIAAGQKKTLIPCYKGIDAYDMPKEFQRLQAQDMGKVGAIQDLLRGIDKITGKGAAERPQETVVVQQTAPQSATVESLLKRAFMFLEDSNWSGAAEYCNKVLDIDPENPEAYVGLLMAGLKVSREEGLVKQDTDFSANLNYKKALRFSSPERKAVLEKYLSATVAHIEEAKRIAEEKRREEERLAKEKAVQEAAKEAARMAELRRFYAPYRKRSALASRRVCVDCSSTSESFLYVGLNTNGTVITFYSDTNHRYEQNWTDIVVITGDPLFGTVAGLRSDGTVLADMDVSNWTDIVDITAEGCHIIGLKANGTVVAVGGNEDGQCNVGSWTDIVAVATSYSHTVGLKSDGTVVAVGENKYGQCNVGSWTDIVDIATDTYHTVGLKADGTVVLAGVGGDKRIYGAAVDADVSGWTDIVDIAAVSGCTVGLKSDGTVIATGGDRNGQYNVGHWRDIVAVDSGNRATVGIKADGTVLITSDPSSGRTKSRIDDWKPFNNIDTLEQEIAQIREKRRQLENEKSSLKAELNNLKGLFTGKRRKEIETRLAEIENKLKKL